MSEESSANGIEVFISFAYGDQAPIRNREVWKRLTECLDALRVEGVVSAWSCRAIDTSSNDTASFESMKRSHVIIFALGKDYLDHPERYRQVLRDLPESGRYLVFAVLLFSGAWYDSPFRIFNPLPSNNTPVADSSDIESAFIEFKEAIKEARQAIYPDRKSRRLVRIDQDDLEQSQPSDFEEAPGIIEESPLHTGSLVAYESFEIIENPVGEEVVAEVGEESSSIIVLQPTPVPPDLAPQQPITSPPAVSAPSHPPAPRGARDFDIPVIIEPPAVPAPSLSKPPVPDLPENAPIEPPSVPAPSRSAPEKREPSREYETRRPAADYSPSAPNCQALESERRRIITDAARRPDFRPAGEPQQDLVDCTVFAPPSAPRGGMIFVQVYAHLQEQAEEALRMASEFDADAKRRAVKSLEEVVARGTRLSFELSMPGLRCADPIQSIVWNGSPDAAQFAVEVPGDCPLGACLGSVIISMRSIPIGHIKFKLRVTETGSEALTNEAVGEEAKRYGLAFISYASADRSKVLARVQMLSLVGIRFFADVLNLRPGDKWETEIYRNIDTCDLFLLFWSKAARDSDWVMNEVRYARKRQPAPEIKPVILEGPPVTAPPEDLNDIHFNDRLVYFILDQSG